jgi:mRNA interferase MazF
MGAFAAGQVALLPFPFSDLSRNKLRPVVLLADASREDWIVCQITSNPFGDARSIQLAMCGLARSSPPTNP